MADFNLSAKSFPGLGNMHHGTGRISGDAHVWDPATVADDVNSFQMKIWFRHFDIHVLSIDTGVPDPPNWFGVSFKHGITSFDAVNIFCTPHPGHAHYDDKDYGARVGKWPELFRYTEILGRQMSIANSNLITIVPFFTSSTYGNLGIFANYWLELVEQILVFVRTPALARTFRMDDPGPRSPRSILSCWGAQRERRAGHRRRRG